MNHRRALRATTDAALTIFTVMSLGVVVWTSDEVLDWNILPDWIDKYAQLILIILSILAGLSVVMSLMSSLAVMAEAAAKNAGIEEPKGSAKAKGLVGVGLLAFILMLAAFQQVDKYRASQQIRRDGAAAAARYQKTETELRKSLAAVLGLFTADIKNQLVSLTPDNEVDVAQFLHAIRASIPRHPRVSVLLPAQAPYKYCAITPSGLRPPSDDSGAVNPLLRDYYVELPMKWERDTVRAMFEGAELDVPKGRDGAFIDTRTPSAWGLIKVEGKVCAVLILIAEA